MSSEALHTDPSSRPPGRAERLSAEDRRDQILREAMGCFADLGFRGTTTRALAERVGISEAALYRYFKSKESLYAAIIDQKMSAPDLIDRLRPAAERSEDEAVLRGIARGLLERVDEDPGFLRLLMYTALEGHSLCQPFFSSRVRRLRTFVTDYVARRIEEGAFRAVDPESASRAFLGMVFDHLNMRHIICEESALNRPLDEVADTFVDIFLGGMRIGPGSRDPESSADDPPPADPFIHEGTNP
ncbi:MAG TPA: TetR/AcrR family transcriptional regulator [Deltaproteobacteria bacterium]|nr:TetR/AcrR family transcriptional regulator [Deltaproteobacteria bacterium]